MTNQSCNLKTHHYHHLIHQLDCLVHNPMRLFPFLLFCSIIGIKSQNKNNPFCLFFASCSYLNLLIKIVIFKNYLYSCCYSSLIKSEIDSDSISGIVHSEKSHPSFFLNLGITISIHHLTHASTVTPPQPLSKH